MLTPLNSVPSPSVTSPWKPRPWVAAPTVVTHGAVAGEAMVEASGPPFPAAVATMTPAAAAWRKASSSAPKTADPDPTE